ncbi:MAG: sugar phosphate isomerase/epimerase [Planctomycetes bacterium]|nr:sugar phosphate isomerase/epimerase [Planctomycetota bacterium]
MTRREFFVRGGAGAALALAGRTGVGAAPAAAEAAKIRIGSMDGVLGGGLGAFDMARACGIAGVEIGLGPSGDHLSLLDPDLQGKYKAKMEETGVIAPSLCLGVLNGVPLKSDPRAERWVSEAIDIAKALGAKTILVPFFGAGTLREKAEKDRVADIVKGLAPKALENGVTLALENTLSAKDNVAIIERAGCPLAALAVYYDVRNSTDNGYDVPAEIPFLKERIRQFHFKDGGDLLGQGKVNFRSIVPAIKAMGYRGWVVLETGVPKGMTRELAAAANAGFIRGAFIDYA